MARDDLRQDATAGVGAELSPSQETALESLLAGRTLCEAANEAGVNRSTLHRWRKEPVFMAALNRRRAESREAAEATLERLRTKALEVTEQALDAGDRTVALAVLRGLGMLDGKKPSVGSDDPQRIAKDQESTARTHELLDSIMDF